MSDIFNAAFWSFVGVEAGIMTIFALGLQVQLGFAGLPNFGHVGFMAIGAYTMAILVIRTGLPLWGAAPIAIFAAIVFGVLVGLPTVRLRSDYLAIATIAFGETIRYLAQNLSITGGPQGTIAMSGPNKAAFYNTSWLGFQSSVQRLLQKVFGDTANKDFTMMVLVWTLALVLLAILAWLVRTPWGRVLKSIREDEDAASALGKNVFWYRLQALALGAALGATAGLFVAFQFSFFSSENFEPLTTFFAFLIVVLGGTGRIWGVPVGAVIFGFIFAGTRFFNFPPLSSFGSPERSYLRLVIVGLILIVLMVFRPQGIFGKREELVLE